MHPTPPASPDELEFANAPNILTLVRIAVVPGIIWMLYQQTHDWDVIAALTFATAGVTDYFDGYLARTRKAITIYGKLLDPLADKILVVAAVVMLQELGKIPPIVVILILSREFAITSLRALASAEGMIIAASNLAKWKTGTQMFALGFMMVNPGVWGIPLYRMGEWLLYSSLLLSFWSAKDYIVAFLKEIRAGKRKK